MQHVIESVKRPGNTQLDTRHRADVQWFDFRDQTVLRHLLLQQRMLGFRSTSDAITLKNLPPMSSYRRYTEANTEAQQLAAALRTGPPCTLMTRSWPNMLTEIANNLSAARIVLS